MREREKSGMIYRQGSTGIKDIGKSVSILGWKSKPGGKERKNRMFISGGRNRFSELMALVWSEN
jgi:hypothetical protein